MVGSEGSVAAKLREKLLALGIAKNVAALDYLIHQEELCTRTFKMDHVIQILMNTVNVIRARISNHVSLPLPWRSEKDTQNNHISNVDG